MRHGFNAVIQNFQGFFHIGKELHTLLCQRGGAVFALKKHYPKLRLQLCDGMAQTWLCNTQTLRCLAEVLRFRQRDKIAQLIQIHRDPPIFQIILESANNMPSDFSIFSIPYAIDKIYQNI